MPVFQMPTSSVFPAGVWETEGLHADPHVQHGEVQSGWMPHMLLCAHQQEARRLSALETSSVDSAISVSLLSIFIEIC